MKKPPLIVCFGELLWDSLPQGLFPGGAPMNVAYHLHHLGADPLMVSAVGRDWLGNELLRRMGQWGLRTEGIARVSTLPTGAVGASVGPNGDVRYSLAEAAAWDRIDATPAILAAAGRARAIVFGSLAQRSRTNRASLLRLKAALPAAAEIVFDVNLREPFDDPGRALALCRACTLVKLNTDEAARLLGEKRSRPGRDEAWARKLAALAGVRTLCLTAGARGAGLLTGGRWFWERGRPVAAQDTVGAGDAFLASLLADLLRCGRTPGRMLARACRLGEWVASQPGATPPYPG